MALLSLGAAVENLMLSAADAGLASCWVAAPIFCPEAARDALALPDEWLPHALVLVGHPDPELRRARAPARAARDAARQPVDRSARGYRAPASWPLKCSRVRATPSSSARPRLPAEVDAGPARIERAALHLAGARRVVARVLLEPGELAPSRRRAAARSSRRRCRCSSAGRRPCRPRARTRRRRRRRTRSRGSASRRRRSPGARGRAACPRRSRRRRPRRAGPGAGRRRWPARARCTRGRGPCR